MTNDETARRIAPVIRPSLTPLAMFLIILIFNFLFVNSQLYILNSQLYIINYTLSSASGPFGHHSILCFVLPQVANAFAIGGKMFCHRWQIVFSLVIKSSTLSSFREFHRWNSASHFVVFPFTPCCVSVHTLL